MKQSKKILKYAAVTAFWLAVWQLAAVAVKQEILIPSPAATLSVLLRLCRDGSFWLSVLMSLLRIISGFLLGVAAGVAGAVISSRFALFRALTSPILRLVRAVPVASFIILALVWIKSGILPVFICFLMVLPMVWDSVLTAIENVDAKLLEMARVYRMTSYGILVHIKIPSVLPTFISTCMTALGFAWKSGVAAEVICRPASSIGGMLQQAKVYLETPEVFALTAVVAALSLLIEVIVRRAVRRFTYDKY